MRNKETHQVSATAENLVSSTSSKEDLIGTLAPLTILSESRGNVGGFAEEVSSFARGRATSEKWRRISRPGFKN